jgi:hypothetical protein
MVKFRQLNMFFVLVLSCFLQIETAMADKIFLVDGRVLTAENVWEEDGLIKYEKFKAIISIEKSKVSRIEKEEYDTNDPIYRERLAKKNARMIVEKLWAYEIQYNNQYGPNAGIQLLLKIQEEAITKQLIEGRSVEQIVKEELASRAAAEPDQVVRPASDDIRRRMNAIEASHQKGMHGTF